MEEALKKIDHIIAIQMKIANDKTQTMTTRDYYETSADALESAKEILLPAIEKLTADRDYWKAEAIKCCAQLGAIRILMDRGAVRNESKRTRFTRVELSTRFEVVLPILR